MFHLDWHEPGLWSRLQRGVAAVALAISFHIGSHAIGYPVANYRMMLMLAVIYAAYAWGRVVGLAAAGLAALYTAWFFNFGSRIFPAMGERETIRFAVYSAALILCALMVGHLKDKLLANGRVMAEQEQQGRITEAIRESEERYRLLAELSQEGIVLYEGPPLVGKIVDASPAILRMIGCEREDMVGSSEVQFITPESVPSIPRSLPPEGTTLELTALRKDGTTFPCQVQARSVPREGPEFYVVAIRDLTERKQAERELRASETRFQRLLQSHIIGIFMADKSGHVSEANDAFLLMVGYSQEDVRTGRLRLDQMTPPEHREKDDAASRSIAETGEAAPWEKEVIHKDGSRIPVMVGVVTVDESRDRSICFALDLRSQKRAEGAVVQLSRQLLLTQDRERRRLARDLHDSTAQRLVAVSLGLRRALHSLAASGSPAEQAIKEAAAANQESLDEIRTLSYLLHPPMLDEFGLRSALRNYVAGFSQRSGQDGG